jgi:uncharacterized protein (DUF433 family)
MDYVNQRDEGCFVSGTRVSLDSVVWAFLKGESPEGIAESFPALTLEQVYGAITFYLANRPEIDRHLEQGKAEFARLREEARQKRPLLYAKLEAAKRETLSSRP